jgi:GT2 family glycosyltransferase
MSAPLTIVVPAYNRTDLLAECLASLNAQRYREFRVVVVDDASPADVAACVRAILPEAEVVRRAANGGFACAANTGIRRADTPFIMLLNDDMTLAPDCLERLMDGLRGGNAAMACPLVLFRDEPDTIYSAGDWLTRGGRPESIGFRERREGFVFERRPFGVSAGAAIYLRQVFDTVGLFDETFVAYFEDADLCMRARAAGFEAVCVPEAIAYHVGSASQAGSTAWRTRQCYRNHALLALKNFGAGDLFLRGPAIVAERIHQTRRLLSAYRAEAGLVRALVEWSRAWREILRSAPSALRERRRKTGLR